MEKQQGNGGSKQTRASRLLEIGGVEPVDRDSSGVNDIVIGAQSIRMDDKCDESAPRDAAGKDSNVGDSAASNVESRRQALLRIAEGGLMAIRGSMFAYPNMSFGGRYKELQGWLKSQQGDGLEVYMMGDADGGVTDRQGRPSTAQSDNFSDTNSEMSSMAASDLSFLSSVDSNLSSNSERRANGGASKSRSRGRDKKASAGCMTVERGAVHDRGVHGGNGGGVSGVQGSEERCMTVVCEDQCVSLVMATPEECFKWRGGLMLAAYAGHATSCFDIEQRAERMQPLLGLLVSRPMLAAEIQLDKSLTMIRCECDVPCAGRYCTQAMLQIGQAANAGASESRRTFTTNRVKTARDKMSTLQQDLVGASNRVVGEVEVAELQAEWRELQEELQAAEADAESLEQYISYTREDLAPSKSAKKVDNCDALLLSALIGDLESDDKDEVLRAAEDLCEMTSTKEDAQIRSRVVVAGAVEPLVRLLETAGISTAAMAAKSIAHIARSKVHHGRILAAGAVPLLQSLLNYGAQMRDRNGDEALDAAAMALVNLCTGEADVRQNIVQCGGMLTVSHVVQLTYPEEPSEAALTSVLALLRSLVSTGADTASEATLSGVEVTVPALVDLTVEGTAEGEALIFNAGGLPPLIKMLKCGEFKAATAALAAISNLVAGNRTNTCAVREALVIPIFTRCAILALPDPFQNMGRSGVSGAAALGRRLASEFAGQPVARNANRAIQELNLVLGPETRRALKELKSTMGAVCNAEQRHSLWRRIELKAALAQRIIPA
eukprot:gene5888-7089_t